MNWIETKNKMPKENQTVWLFNINTGWVNLGCRVYVDSGWLWAITNGVIYNENNCIVSECELDDDYNVTHWSPLPELKV